MDQKGTLKNLGLLVMSMLVFGTSCKGNNDKTLSEAKEIQYTDYTVEADDYKGRYCIYEPANGRQSNTVLYYFHGAFGNEYTWLQNHKKMYSFWATQQGMVPYVVTLTFGERWALFKRRNHPQAVTFAFFWEKLLPEIEKKIAVPLQKRYLMGISMGGYSATQLFLRKPGFFQKAVLISPANSMISPFATQAEIDSYIERNRPLHVGMASRLKAFFLRKDPVKKYLLRSVKGYRKYFPDQQSWEEAYFPRLAAQYPELHGAALYIACGREDELGFFEGARALSDIARKQSIPVIWRPLPGGHNTIHVNYREIAEFLLQ